MTRSIAKWCGLVAALTVALAIRDLWRAMFLMRAFERVARATTARWTP